MKKLKIPLIRVVPWNNNKLSNLENNALFFLERDNWNDHDYYTSYHLHASGKLLNESSPKLIGYVKILKIDQQVRESNLIPLGELEELNGDFISMPTSLDFYERLSLISKEYRDRILIALRDIIIHPDFKLGFENNPGYKNSLFRGMQSNDQIFELAPLLLERDYEQLHNQNLEFSFSIPEMEEALVFNFVSPKYGWTEKSLPNRIVTIIGKNGSGKSTILSRLSRIAFSSPLDRQESALKNLGKLVPKGLGFTRVIILSYSPFDAFNTPGIYKAEKLNIIDEMKNGLGRYVFCGVRDIVAELEAYVPDMKVNDKGKLRNKDIINDRNENTLLKTALQLAKEFSRNIQIISDLSEEDLFLKAVKLLKDESSMHNLFEIDFFDSSDKANENFFRDLSTGHKFVIHAITSIIAFSAPRALLLFDEPENHLHPPILAALMKAIRHVLDKKNATMIVATHSPVVLQETLSQHVYILRREGDKMRLYRPQMETFGENIGLLTQEAFGLNTDITDFHNTLDDIVLEEHDKDPDKTMKTIEELFDLGLSMQARSYVQSKLYQG